jgi:hypothetical protein
MRAVRLLVALCVICAVGSSSAEQAAGIAPSGQKGYLHKVEKGDTLWDITSHYLGTPWTWPSIWKENDGINNPHLIYPGDLIWITEHGIRKVTPEEAEALLAGQVPSALSEIPLPDAPQPALDPFAALDGHATFEGRLLLYPGLHRASFVTAEELSAAAAVLGTHEPNYWISQTQRMIVSAGEGHAEIGEDYTVFRVRRKVLHPTTGKPAGFMVEVVGRAEVEEVHPETSFARVTMAYAEIEPGDRLLPYEDLPQEFTTEPSAESVTGIVLAMQPDRLWSADKDVVVVDRGTEDGLGPGRELIVYRPGDDVRDPLSGSQVLEPDDLVARLFVLRAGHTSSVALVTEARAEIRDGDRFRTP